MRSYPSVYRQTSVYVPLGAGKMSFHAPCGVRGRKISKDRKFPFRHYSTNGRAPHGLVQSPGALQLAGDIPVTRDDVAQRHLGRLFNSDSPRYEYAGRLQATIGN